MNMQKKIVTFGEIMLRLATPGYNRLIQSSSLNASFGGGEANVAVSLANYVLPVEFVTRLPENEIADWCISELRKLNVGTKNIVRGGDRVGIYFLESGAVARPSKVIYDRAAFGYCRSRKGHVRLGRNSQRCLLVSLDGNHACHFAGCCRCLSGSHSNGKRYGYHRFV
jgi:2-dehydro-3-deoxygluconokinase